MNNSLRGRNCYPGDMSTQITSLLEKIQQDPQSGARVFGEVRKLAAYTRPDMDDARLAVEIGRAEGVQALLGSPKLAVDEKMSMATQMLQQFSQDPLSAPRQSEILEVLLREGADVQAQDLSGKTPMDYIAQRLDRMNEAERALARDGRPRARSGAAIRMTQLRDQLAAALPLNHRSRVDVEQFQAGMGQSPAMAPEQASPRY